MAKIGVDVGGTFTDLILEIEPEKVFVHKVPSTPADQSIGVLKGILEICEIGGISPSDVSLIVHGTTVATNITIEHNGAEVGMLTTRGFRDIIHIGRHKRPHNFSIQFDVPWQSKPLVKRRNRIPITERLLPPDGRIETPLAEDEVRAAVEKFKENGVEAVTICFLFSFLNDSHEKRAKEIVLEGMPDAYVCTSSEVVDVIREYERFSTTAMNAYVGPRTSRYLRNLAKSLQEKGIQAELRVMQSNGGIATVETCSEKAVTILLSGPAGGVIGGRYFGEMAGQPNIITVDIGGTSADISTIPETGIKIKNPRDTYVGDYPVLVPMIDMITIGAGGGSIAHLDEAGMFRVGPRSAGADPGPACYAKGGTEPTVTDAQVVLGRLDIDRFLGGDLPIDFDLARKAIHDRIAQPLGMSLEDAALGIIKIINSNMALAIRSNSVARGIDPRNFALMPFGGAGPLHGTALAEAVFAREVIVPPAPGITAAIGLLVTDMKYEFTRSVLAVLNSATQDQLDAINKAADDLTAQAARQLEQDGVPAAAHQFTRIAECRYQGQGFELRAEMPAGALTMDNKQVVMNNFHEQHRMDYGYAFDDGNVEIMTLRIIATANVEALKWPRLEAANGTSIEPAYLYSRETIFDSGEKLETPRYDRLKLKSGHQVPGPAVVIQHNSTTLVPPGYVAKVDDYSNLIVSRT
ncbi:hydantoinase/oxoprolinase family protein [Marinibaculum pumilum]|uniref:Hydantoinase/oxoprolinase family protein n=1 Tax=Marinibaculum pumilum TaxID=1766165 RepID=A0ABV7L5J9_9PROT